MMIDPRGIPRMRSGRPRRYRLGRPLRDRGFTLLEVIVALGLVAILLAALGAAVDFHYRVVQKARAQVEEAQLARTLLERIAQDIRGAVPYDPINFEKLIPGLVTQAAQSDFSSLAGDAGLGSELLGELTSESDVSELGGDWTMTTLPRSVPGLYGGSDWIEVDVSRLPRPDQLSSEIMLSSEGLFIDRVSDVKTVAYFVVSPEETINYSFTAMPGVTGFEEQGGLVRRELDRAVTVWAAQTGELDTIDQQLQPIAPEVAAIQFAYFDGSEWTDSWDSGSQGCLPKAVEIRLYLRPKSTSPEETLAPSSGAIPELSSQGVSATTSTSSGLLLDTSAYHVYRTVVYLPAAHETGTLGATAGAESTGESGSGEEMTPEEEGMEETPEEPSPSGGGSAAGPGGGRSEDSGRGSGSGREGGGTRAEEGAPPPGAGGPGGPPPGPPPSGPEGPPPGPPGGPPGPPPSDRPPGGPPR
ncbi:MAG: hypothetical protein KatS3mg112_0578 [Thermogutta sp.]|nr:MAG: hypothetical protein KatS3mg112_0578 [Thermogutta sp.]